MPPPQQLPATALTSMTGLREPLGDGSRL